MQLKDYIKIYDNKIDPKLISNLIKFSNNHFASKEFVQASVGSAHNIDKDIRSVTQLPMSHLHPSLSNVHWTNLLTWMVKSTFIAYSKEFKNLGMDGFIEPIQLLRYDKSNHYDWHVDDGPGMFRRASFVMMLNNDYKGGLLQFKFGDNIETIDLKVGRMVVWPSSFLFPHRVTPIEEGTKHTVVCWGK